MFSRCPYLERDKEPFGVSDVLFERLFQSEGSIVQDLCRTRQPHDARNPVIRCHIIRCKAISGYGVFALVGNIHDAARHFGIAERVLPCHTVDDIHIGGFIVRSGQEQRPAAGAVEQAGDTHEIQQLAVLRFVTVQQRTDKVRGILVPDKLCPGFRYAHQRIDGSLPFGILPADNVPGLQPLCLL